jgi:tRNA threonylcarbamoyladenosine biosynthesis protein TsaB
MSNIVYLDCSTFVSQVALIQNEEIVFLITNEDKIDTTIFIHSALKDMVSQSNIDLKNMDAVVVMNGPGSYTGLRVALATAKGLCFALNIPLLLLNKLESILFSQQTTADKCAFIKAREGEYFVAKWNALNEEILSPTLMLKNDVELLIQNSVSFSDDAVSETEFSNCKTVFTNVSNTLELIKLVVKEKKQASLLNAEPFYLKQVYIL